MGENLLSIANREQRTDSSSFSAFTSDFDRQFDNGFINFRRARVKLRGNLFEHSLILEET
jgi:hypothetical protein